MSDPRQTAPLPADRVKRVAAGVRIRVTQTPDRSARIGSYKAADGVEREVMLVQTAADDWELRDRAGNEEQTIDGFGAELDEAVAAAVEYRRDKEQHGIRTRATLTARETLRLRAALAESALSHGDLGRRAA